MMAACRYYTISNNINTDQNRFVRFLFFTREGVLLLITAGWLYLIAVMSTLFGLHQTGKDRHGYCGTRPFHTLSIFAFYIGSFVCFGFVANFLTVYYCRRITTFMRTHERNTQYVRNDHSETKAILRVIFVIYLFTMFDNN